MWLRNHDYFPNESVDLIYLDPPFNSNAAYNVIFSEPSGEESPAQLRAFDDTWKWDSEASAVAFQELATNSQDIAEFIALLSNRRDKTSRSMAAYLSMMSVRLLELHRVLRSTGSIYLHCDSTASHYLKIILDQMFGLGNFRNEIVWKRTSAHGDTTQGARHFGRVHDVILRYSKSRLPIWNPQYGTYDPEYIERFYSRIEPETGRRFQAVDLTARKPGGDTLYEWNGKRPYRGRYWAYSKQKMEEFERQGKLFYTKNGMPRLKYYLDEMSGMPIQDIWNDIPHSLGSERLGYDTQKPLTLLERIIKASSNERDTVLDPFCGCGTALVAAQKLGRRWIGIDVTHLAIFLVEQRLQDSFGKEIRNTYRIHGNPYDLPSAKALWNKDPKEFELWALSLVGARPRARDGGVDGVLGFVDKDKKVQRIVVQVKGGESLMPSIIRDLIGTVDKEKAAIGLLISLHEPTSGMKELAIHSGSYKSELWNRDFPRIQIRSVKELLIEGKQFDLPPQVSPLKKAERIKEQGYTEPLFNIQQKQ